MNKKSKILIVEDNELFRTSLVIALEQEEELEVIGTCSNGQQCLSFIKENRPDFIIIDIGMPVLNGLETCKKIKENNNEIKVIIFSVYADEQSVFKALKARADAYCTKDTKFQKLIEVIKNVQDGAVWLDPSIASYIHNFMIKNDGTKNAKDKFNISERELEILELLAEGKSNKEIASSLFITINTVKAHVCNIMQKLSAKSRTDAAVKASKQGLI